MFLNVCGCLRVFLSFSVYWVFLSIIGCFRSFLGVFGCFFGVSGCFGCCRMFFGVFGFVMGVFLGVFIIPSQRLGDYGKILAFDAILVC